MTRQKLYKANVSWDDTGATVWLQCGWLTPCGEWVGFGDNRWRRTAEWFDNERDARASKAGEIAAMAARLMRQSHDLLARDEVVA
jgi:hypothetical protein